MSLHPQPYIEFKCGHRLPIYNKHRFASTVLTTNPFDLDPLEAGAILSGEKIQIDSPNLCVMCEKAKAVQSCQRPPVQIEPGLHTWRKRPMVELSKLECEQLRNICDGYPVFAGDLMSKQAKQSLIEKRLIAYRKGHGISKTSDGERIGGYVPTDEGLSIYADMVPKEYGNV